MSKKLIGSLTGAGVLALILAAFVVFTPTGKIVQQQALGALSSPDISSPYLAWGGVATYNFSTTFAPATSSVLSTLTSPVATSTCTVMVEIASAGSLPSSVTFDVSTSSDGVATTSPDIMHGIAWARGDYAYSGSVVAASGQLATTRADGTTNMLFAPSTPIIVKTSTTTPAATYPSGFFKASCRPLSP